MVTAQDPALGFAKASLVTFTCMLGALGALFAYFILGRPGFAVFGVAMVLSFIVALGIEAFRLARTVTPSGSST